MTTETRWLIDGMNLIGSVPDGWWRNRERAMLGLVEKLGSYHEARGERVIVVFDGEAKPRLERGNKAVEIVFAPGGAGAADDEIVRRVSAEREPSALQIVTSDAQLARWVRALGARVVSSASFRDELERTVAQSGPPNASCTN